MSQHVSDDSQLTDGEFMARLSPVEAYWRDRQEFFASRGYMLRRRFRTDWIPSWVADPTVRVFHSEDSLRLHALRPHLVDARRMSDDKLVLMKMIQSKSDELQIATYLSSKELRRDARNHCVPVLDVLVDPEDPETSYLVMPFLRYIDRPPFDTVGSILDCCEQLLEGLTFLHEHNVAHRDCAYKNIMMDATAMYPQSFHPMAEDSLPDNLRQSAPVLSRSDVPITFYFIDFGISTQFAPEDNARLVTGRDGMDQQVPELSDLVPYDPFKVDIFILGNLFRQCFFEKYSNVDVLGPLIQDMINPDPLTRPTAIEALEAFQVLRRGISTLNGRWRPKPRNEPAAIQAIFDTFSLCSVVYKSLF